MEDCPYWRIRVGPREDHRVVYSIDDKDKAIFIDRIGPRKDIDRR
jgi:mRNA-degrading endonuclease RelE of RelBE toxin-antitoxin system